MSYFALAVARDADGWSASEVSLADAADLEDVSDRLREVNPAADLSLLFVESDDAYLAVLRLDQGEDLRVFGSDVAFAAESRLGALLLGEFVETAVDINVSEIEAAEADGAGPAPGASAAGVGAAGEAGAGEVGADEDSGTGLAGVAVDVEPAGDLDILADVGIGASRLLRLCTREGMLPSDITTQLCRVLGCADEVEELRGS